jgi:hypothetical protein
MLQCTYVMTDCRWMDGIDGKNRGMAVLSFRRRWLEHVADLSNKTSDRSSTVLVWRTKMIQGSLYATWIVLLTAVRIRQQRLSLRFLAARYTDRPDALSMEIIRKYSGNIASA